MSDQQTEAATAEHEVTDAQLAEGVVPFVHRLGGDVHVTAYTADGEGVGFLFVNPITEAEVEVALVPGVPYARLVAVPVPPEDEGDARP